MLFRTNALNQRHHFTYLLLVTYTDNQNICHRRSSPQSNDFHLCLAKGCHMRDPCAEGRFHKSCCTFPTCSNLPSRRGLHRYRNNTFKLHKQNCIIGNNKKTHQKWYATKYVQCFVYNDNYLSEYCFLIMCHLAASIKAKHDIQDYVIFLHPFGIIFKSLFVIIFSLPGHGFVKQVLVSSCGPWQSSPPWAGGGLSHTLERVLVPSPQVTEHVPHDPQMVHPPSTILDRSIYEKNPPNPKKINTKGFSIVFGTFRHAK